MSKDATRGIDPRFDPRFQRGYIPDASATAHVEPEQAARTAPPERTERTERTTPVAPLARRAEVAPPVSTTSHEQHHVDLLAEIGFASDEAHAHADPGMNIAEFDDEPELPADSLPARARFWIALGVSVLFVIVGAWMYWNAVSNQMSMTGQFTTSDSVTQQMLISLSIGLVQAGAVGVIVVLAIWAITGLRRSVS